MITIPIRMQFLEPHVNSYLTPAFEIRYAKWWGWLEKILIWALKKSHCLVPYWGKEQYATEILIDPQKAASEIVRLAYHQLELMNGHRPTRILLGRKQLEELLYTETKNLNIWNSFQFEVQFSQITRSSNPYRTGHSLFSVPIEVIPWMDGVLVL